MKWVEVECQIPNESNEALGAVVLNWPEVQGIAVEGVGDAQLPHADFGEWFDESLLGTSEVTVRFYLPEPATPESAMERTLAALATVTAAGLSIGDAAESVHCHLIDEDSFASAWREDYDPIQVGERLIVVPEWDRVSLEQDAFHGRLPIIMESGMAFGTGTHQTTQLCLEALEQFVGPATRVLDVGTGTAILAIGAARLGAAHVDAIDIDPVAVRVAEGNVCGNHVEDRVAVYEGNLLSPVDAPQLLDESYDLIVANILRDIVIALLPAVLQRLRMGGRFLASGLIHGQAQTVSEAFTAVGLRVVAQVERDDWVLLVGEKTA